MDAQDRAAAVPDEAGAGRVLVFARVRPPTPWETGVATSVEIDDSVGLVRVRNDADAAERVLAGQAAESALSTAEARTFNFDAVFPEHATQRDVFLRAGLPVLRECMKGFNGTVLAYGQTGSGKTHSLLHQGQKAEEAGLLPRLIASLFLQIAQDTANVYTVDAAVVQVYNEQVDDLLNTEHQSGGGRNLDIQNAGTIPGLTWITCKRPETMIDAFARARTNLVYAETKLNKASSRSHAVFQLRITKRERAKGPTAGARKVECTTARLCVVDLAGSERVKKSGVEGTQFKEATAINRSLLAFGNVVSALASKKAHVPLRDSKLTRILDGSIGGNCKTALLVCASPATENSSETLNTFDFASRAMRVEVNAKVNTSVMEVSAKALLADLSEDCNGLGGIPLGVELLELRRKSSEAAERAQTEARKKDLAIQEVEKQAKKLQQLFEVAEQKTKSAQEEAEALRRTQQAATSDAEGLRKTLAESEKRAEELAKSAAEMRTKIQTAEKTAKEWQTVAKMREQEAKKEAQKEKVEDVKKQKEEITRIRMEAQTLTKQATMKQEQAVKNVEAAENTSKQAQERAEAAEKQLVELREQLQKSETAAEIARATAATVKADIVTQKAKAEESTQVAVQKAQEEVQAERTRVEEVVQESTAQVEAMRARHEELEEENRALTTEVTNQAATLVCISAELTEAKAALQELSSRSEASEAELRRHFGEELRLVQAARDADIASLKAEHERSSGQAEQDLSDVRESHTQELHDLQEHLTAQQQKWESERIKLESEHAIELEGQRRHFEQQLAELRSEHESKLAALRSTSETRLEELQQLLDSQIAKTEQEREKWNTIKEEAVQDAWERGNAQQRRLASAFKAARSISAAKEAEVQNQKEDLARRFAARESREDDVAQINSQQRALGQQQRALMHRNGQVKGLSLQLQNRDDNDRIFSQSEFRGRRRPVGVVPAMPGRKLGDTRCFLERQTNHERTQSANSRTCSRTQSMDMSPMNRTCPGGFSSSPGSSDGRLHGLGHAV